MPCSTRRTWLLSYSSMSEPAGWAGGLMTVAWTPPPQSNTWPATSVWDGTPFISSLSVNRVRVLVVSVCPVNGTWPIGRYSRTLTHPQSGGHALVMVGHGDATRCCPFRNLWSTGWADADYGDAPCAFVVRIKLALDVWIVKHAE